MATKNDITGKKIRTGYNSQLYKDNYDKIFGNKKSVITDDPVNTVIETKTLVEEMPCQKTTLNQ